MTDIGAQLADVTADFSGLVSVAAARARSSSSRRTGWPTARTASPNTVGHALRDGQRHQELHRRRRRCTDRGRPAGARLPRPSRSRERPAADRRRRDGRAPADAPIRDRRLLRRGPGRAAAAEGAGPRPRLDAGLPAGASTGFPANFAAGTRFKYSNGGFVVLAIVAERVSGRTFADLLRERVFEPGGHDGDRLPALRRAARRRGDRLPRRRPHERVLVAGRSAAATAARTRPPPTCTRSGPRCSRGASSPPTQVRALTDG